ncbi:MAG: hypothetical protein CYPHOPRED_003760 [Cyphobasidiales sp. Tagirdzhanova-0007]|nr:MAG: hypothetical protein CYPHOPRED_003760 [Cyphobasidiales sp. Tagirdzhanova-0007]
MTVCLPRAWKVELSVRGSSRPPRLENIAIGGRQKAVSVLDCDGRFSVERTYQLVRSHLTRRVQEHAATIPALYSAAASSEDLHEETLRSLERVHLFTIASSVSLAATLLQLPAYFQQKSADELAFVLIDNISAFYWQDRYQAEQEKNAPKGNPSSTTSSMKNILQAINLLREKYGVVTVLTNWAFPNQGDRQPTSNSPFYRQHLPKPYPSPFSLGLDGSTASLPSVDPLHPFTRQSSTTFHITHHLTLHALQAKVVDGSASLENAEKEEPFRSMDQQEIGSRAFLRIPGIENGDELGRWELVIRSNVIDGL